MDAAHMPLREMEMDMLPPPHTTTLFWALS